MQAAELKPIADAVGVHRPRRRASTRSICAPGSRAFSGPRKFKDGDKVKEGQVVFTIEPETYQAAVDQKTAQRDCRQGGARQCRAPAPARRRAAAHQHRHAGRPTTSAQPSSARPRPQLEEAEAKLRDAQIQLSYTEIKSPISGRIGRAAVSPGNLVGPDSGVLATVVSEDPMQVLFSVTQREMLEAASATPRR